MLRSIFAVIVGYVVLGVIMMAGFAPAFMNRELAFSPGSLDAKRSWTIYTVVHSVIAAVAGGYVCSAIAKNIRPVVVFAVIALIVGIGDSVQNLYKPASTLSTEEIQAKSLYDLLEHLRQPDWYAFALPVIGFAGILIGGKMRR